MITADQLFRRRMLANIRFQYRTIRMAADWIVAAYIIIPALAVAVYQYAQWWLHPPMWFAHIPLTSAAVMLTLFSFTGTMRYFLESGDQLFLLQKHAWIRRLIRSGIVYSLILFACTTALLVSLISPLLVLKYYYTVPKLVLLFVWVLVFKSNCCLAMQMLSMRYRGFLWFIAKSLLRIIAGACFVWLILSLAERPYLVILGCILLILSFIWLAKVRLEMKGTFDQDVHREWHAKMRLGLWMMAQLMEKKPRFRRRRPLVLRNSRLLFKHRTQANGLAELAIKTFLRNTSKLYFYGGFTLLCAAAVLLLPLSMKWVMWIAAAFLLAYWVKMGWREMESAPFLNLFKWRDEAKTEAMRKVVFYVMLPGILLISLIFGLSAFSFIGALIMLPAGALLGYVAAGAISITR